VARVALVTGARGGIGAAICPGFATTVGGSCGRCRGRRPDDARGQPSRRRRGICSARPARPDRPNAGVQHVAPVVEFPEDQWYMLIALMPLGWTAH
jgi:hypothetical protein